MKLKLILIIILLHFNLFVKSQAFILDYKLNDNIKNYYEKIHYAENSIVQNQLKKSILYYDSAFKINKYPFAKDIFNAFYANVEIDRLDTALSLYKKLLDLGLQKSYLKKTLKISKFLNKYSSVIRTYIPQTKIDKLLLKQLDTLYNINQKNRISSGGNYSNYLSEIKRDDNISGIKLLQLISQKGFPNDYNLGIESERIFKHNFYFIIWHQQTNRQINFTETILKAINEGHIEVHVGASLIDKYFSDPIFSNTGITQIRYKKEKIDSCCFVRDFANDNREQIIQLKRNNEMRKLIGLETLEENQKKIIFKFQETPYVFPQYDYMGNIILGIEKKEYFKMFRLDKMINIKK